MFKTALKLISLVAIMAIGITLFLVYRFNRTSEMIHLVPKDAHLFCFVNTREIIKDLLKYGTKGDDSVKTIFRKNKYLSFIENPKETGINLFSEVVYFEAPVTGENISFGAILLKISDKEKLESLLKTKAPAGLFDLVKDREKYSYSITSDKQYAFAWNQAVMAIIPLFFAPLEGEKLEKAFTKALAFDSKNSISENKAVNDYYYNKKPDILIWIKEGNSRQSVKELLGYNEFVSSVDFLEGKVRLTGIGFDKEYKTVDFSNEELVNYDGLYLAGQTSFYPLKFISVFAAKDFLDSIPGFNFKNNIACEDCNYLELNVTHRDSTVSMVEEVSFDENLYPITIQKPVVKYTNKGFLAFSPASSILKWKQNGLPIQYDNKTNAYYYASVSNPKLSKTKTNKVATIFLDDNACEWFGLNYFSSFRFTFDKKEGVGKMSMNIVTKNKKDYPLFLFFKNNL